MMSETPLLDGISGPEDLQEMDYSQLVELAEELRRTIIETTSKCGGHIAPSLGVVELTIAIHRVFDSPRDRIVWDGFIRLMPNFWQHGIYISTIQLFPR